MKKLLIATAIAATIATGAHAADYTVSSNITNLQLWIPLGNTELLSGAGGYSSGVAFGGTAQDANNDGIIDSSAVTLVGEAGFIANDIQFRLTFNLGSGSFVAGSGTTFSSGTVLVDAYSVDAGGWVNYATVDAATTNLPFLANQPGHLTGQSGHTIPQTTAGLLLAPGTHALPGLWDGVDGSAGYNNAVSAVTLLGNPAGMFFEGSVTLAPVPVPAAAWMFGSAVLGLAGVSRKRKTV